MMWENADPNEVRQVWADALGEFEGSDIGYAIDSLQYVAPDFPPTMLRFVELCRMGRQKRIGETQRLAPPDARGPIHPDVAKRIGAFVAETSGRRRDPKQWARRLVERYKDGDKTLLPIQRKWAQEMIEDGLFEDAETRAERLALRDAAGAP